MSQRSLTILAALFMLACAPATAGDTTAGERVLHFPDQPVGVLKLGQVKHKMVVLLAKGTVKVPAQTVVTLKLNYNGSQNPKFLQTVGAQLDGFDTGGFPVDDEFMKCLKYMPNLQMLCLEDSEVTDAGTADIAGLKKLRDVKVSKSMVGCKTIEYISRLPLLFRLGISHLEIKDDCLRGLEKCTTLYAIEADGDGLSDEALVHFGKITHLQTLDVNKNAKITNAGIAKLKNLKDLHILQITDTSCTPMCAEQLKAFPNLKHIEVNYERFGKEGLAYLNETLPSVKVRSGNGSRVPLEIFAPLHPSIGEQTVK